MKSPYQSGRKWLTIILAWTIAGLLFSAQSYYYRLSVGQEVSWTRILVFDTSYFLFWIFFTPLLLWLARRFRIEKSRWLSRIIIQVVAAVIVAIAHRALYDLIFLPLRQTAESPFTWERFSWSVLGFFDYGVLIYMIVLFVSHALEYHQRFQSENMRASRLQGELAAAQLQALRMQLNPHFLFNTLNAIAVLIHEDPKTATAMVEALSDLLRQSLANSDQQLVTLRDELKFLQLYLKIEQIRFGDRLSIRLEVPPEVLPSHVPHLILQPLAENAIRHGIAKRGGPGEILIQAGRENGMLKLRVQDDGNGVRDHANVPNSTGVGLVNTRRRLQTLYGDQASFELSNGAHGGATAEIRLPIHMRE